MEAIDLSKTSFLSWESYFPFHPWTWFLIFLLNEGKKGDFIPTNRGGETQIGTCGEWLFNLNRMLNNTLKLLGSLRDKQNFRVLKNYSLLKDIIKILENVYNTIDFLQIHLK